MKIFSAQLKGTTTVATGSNVSLTGSFSGSIAGIDINSTNAFTASLSNTNVFTASLFGTNTFTSSASARLNSIETISASNIARLDAVEIISASNISRINSLETTSASVDSLNTIQNNRLTDLEIKTGSLATTGSNTFIGTQTITGSLFISANLIVQGTSSLENITASAVSIGTNIVNLNTANPAIRYAGLVIGDSGSVGGSGSFLYDSVQDEMIFVHRGTSTVTTSSVILMGPQTFDNVGNETYPTNNRIQKGTGNEHLADSCILEIGGNVGINCASPGFNLDVNGTLNVATSTGSQIRMISYGGSSAKIRGTQATLGIEACGALTLETNGANERLRIESSGVSTFSCQICSPSFRGGSSLNTTNALSGQNASTAEATIYSFNHCTAGWSIYSAQGLNYFAGNVGINEITPLAPLHFSKQTTWGSSDNRVININNTGTGGDINQPHNMGSITWYSGNSTPTAEIAAYRNTPASGNNIELRFYTANVGTPLERMRIMSTGCVGIGNTSPNTMLHTTIQTCWATNGTVANSYPIATFSQCDCAGGARGLQIGVPTGGVNSPVYLKVANTGARFSILDSSNNEDFTISGGRVGIGASSPSADGYLHICKNTNNVGILIQSVCKTSNPSYLRLLGINSNNATTQLQIVHRGSHSDSGYTDRIDFSLNNGTSWCERVMRFDFNGNIGMCHGSLSIADQIAIGGTGTGAAKGYKKFYSFGSGFDNPTINLISVGNPTNSVTVIKVTVYTTGFGSNTANIHTGYAMKSWVASYACPMSVVAGFGNNNVGTIAWSGETLTYTANRVSNYDSYHVEVDYGGSNGSMSASWF